MPSTSQNFESFREGLPIRNSLVTGVHSGYWALRDKAWGASPDSSSWTSVPFDARVEQQPEPVVLEIPHPVSDASDLFGHQVLGFDRSRRDAGHMEVEDLGFPA